MSEESKACSHPKESRRLMAVEIGMRCKDCGLIRKAWIGGKIYKIVEDELETEIQDIDELDLEAVKSIDELLLHSG